MITDESLCVDSCEHLVGCGLEHAGSRCDVVAVSHDMHTYLGDLSCALRYEITATN